MGMIRGGDIGKGSCLIWNNGPYLVTEREFVSPGKGSAFARVKMKNMKTGQVLTQTIKTADSVEEAEIVNRECQFQYSDDENYSFMDNDTFENYSVPKAGLEEKGNYLKVGESYVVVMWEGNAIDIVLPYKMVFTVTESENAIKGDTVSGATKPVRVETGLVVRVPLFIKQGEKILVNTDTGDYVERIND
jgi:elongation factor P